MANKQLKSILQSDVVHIHCTDTTTQHYYTVRQVVEWIGYIFWGLREW